MSFSYLDSAEGDARTHFCLFDPPPVEARFCKYNWNDLLGVCFDGMDGQSVAIKHWSLYYLLTARIRRSMAYIQCRPLLQSVPVGILSHSHSIVCIKAY